MTAQIDSLERLTWNPAWSPKIGDAVAKFEIKDSFAAITLRDGSQVIDSGTRLAIRGAVTRNAIAVMIAQAEKHGWSKVMLTGSVGDQQRIAAALEKRGIEIANPPAPEQTRPFRPEYKPSWSKREESRKS